MGFWNTATQQAILDTEVAIAGNGGVGNLLGIELARIGVQRFQIADPEVFDAVNANRVVGARVETIGRNKAEVLKEDILSINPEAEVEVYDEGITPENIGVFLSTAHLAINGLELTHPELGAMLARSARSRIVKGGPSPISVVDVEYIGHAGQATVFSPRSRTTFERFMGLDERAPLDEIAGRSVKPSRYLVYLPPYGDLGVLAAVQGGAALPSNMIGAGVAAQLGVAEVVKLVRARVGERGRRPTYAPRIRWYDAYTGHAGTTTFPRTTHYRHLSGAFLRNLTNRHESTSYTTDARSARGDYDHSEPESSSHDLRTQ